MNNEFSQSKEFHKWKLDTSNAAVAEANDTEMMQEEYPNLQWPTFRFSNK